MPERSLVTRRTLGRELVVNAATKPLAVAVPAGVVVAAFLLEAAWLLPLAVVLYLALALTTLFDPEEAARVGRDTYRRSTGPARPPLPPGLAPEIASLVSRAHVEEARIRQAVGDSRLPLADVAIEVETLMTELERHADRAHAILSYLGEQRPFQLHRRLQALRDSDPASEAAAESRDRAVAAVEHQMAVGEHLRAEYARFTAEMEHVVASLGAIHGELVRISVAEDELARESLAEQVRELRRRVEIVAEGMDEATDELRAARP